jgi:large subunit ribosomal protein L10
MTEEVKKISANRQKKVVIVDDLTEKLGKSKMIVFTNFQGLTHKQLEGLKRAIKPMQAEFVVAKNSLILRALDANKIKVEDESAFFGPTGTLITYADIVSPLKELAKLIKELGIPNVKLGIMDGNTITGDQVLKISSLPSKETLLTQLVFTLQSPIQGLHRSLNWNLQKLVMTLSEVAKKKPATTVSSSISVPTPVAPAAQAEPETIQAENVAELTAELPEKDNPTIEAQTPEGVKEEVSEGGEN